MNFKLGKKYIVKVTEKGIIPREEFLEERYIDKDHDDLDFLTDEEKVVIVNEVLDNIRAEIVELWQNEPCVIEGGCLDEVLEIIDKYRGEQCQP